MYMLAYPTIDKQKRRTHWPITIVNNSDRRQQSKAEFQMNVNNGQRRQSVLTTPENFAYLSTLVF